MLALQGKVRGTPWPLWLGAADKRQAGAIIQDRGSGLHSIVLPTEGQLTEPGPGIWPRGRSAGYCLITIVTEVDQDIQAGDPVAGVYDGYVQERRCRKCGTNDLDGILSSERGPDEPAWINLECDACGATDVECRPWLNDSPSSRVADGASAQSDSTQVRTSTSQGEEI